MARDKGSGPLQLSTWAVAPCPALRLRCTANHSVSGLSHPLPLNPQVDKGLAPLANSNNEQWCMGLDGLDKRSAEYYKAGARFAKWRKWHFDAAGLRSLLA